MKTKNMLKYLKKICAPGMNLCHAAVQTYVFFSLLEVVEFAFNLIFIHVKLYFILILKKELLLYSIQKYYLHCFFFLK